MTSQTFIFFFLLNLQVAFEHCAFVLPVQRSSTLSVGDEEGKEDGFDDGMELGSDVQDHKGSAAPINYSQAFVGKVQ